ncbi:MAG: 50S ribosomal protein L18 [Bdellovibrionaceae bacterium]|nr:50S ribosomal protein L18 [Pseudobdellovibrionaceae bacterium]
MRVTFIKSTAKKVIKRLKARVRIRKKISGTAEVPRLAVFKSNKFITAQLIDDQKGITLVSYSSKLIDKKAIAKSIEMSKKVGLTLGQKALNQNIKNVVFDRSGYRFHGRVKSLAEGARESGLKF